MKTKVTTLLLLAVTAMMFASCGGKESKELADNTLVYGDKTYKMTPLATDWGALWNITADSEEKTDGKTSMSLKRIYVYKPEWEGKQFGVFMNKTYDLLDPQPGTLIELSFREAADLELYAHVQNVNDYIDISGSIDDVVYSNADKGVFTEGTLRIDSDESKEKPVTMVLDGKLKNGKDLKMKLVITDYAKGN